MMLYFIGFLLIVIALLQILIYTELVRISNAMFFYQGEDEEP